MPYSRGWPVALYTHPFELALGVVLVINGVRGIANSFSPSVGSLPLVPLILFLIVSTLGGVGVIVSFLAFKPATTGPPRFTGPRLERASLFLVAASYAAVAALLIGVNGWDGFAQGLLCIVIALACILRTVAIARASKIIVRQLTEHREASE